MKLKSNKLNTTFLFYTLVCYILLQFIWWEVLLVKQSNQIFENKKKLTALSVSDPKTLEKDIKDHEEKKNRYILMIIGEGTIFLILISIGILRVYKAHLREKEISLQQKNFLLSVSHELKTPLATSKLNIQTLLKRDLPKEKQHEFLKKTLLENERLNQLIENILISTRLDDFDSKGNLLINKHKVDLTQLIIDTVNKSFTADQQKRISCHLDNDVFLATDLAIFPSIIINLIDNALKYSKSDVFVELKKEANFILLLFSDRGTSISILEKDKIFEKFYRSGNEETRKNKGTGLGLFIVKKLVEMHNGSIVVYPNTPTGNVFEIKIKTN
jgi:signal transduction histidine kinase